MRLFAAVTLAGIAAAATLGGCTSTSASVATIDGIAISREAYEEYALVFTTPDGSRQVSDEDVLLSLVNQVLVQSEANQRGLVLTDEEVSDATANTRSLGGVGDDAGLRERVRMFLLFQKVKSAVVGYVEIPLEVLEAEYSADSSLQVVGLSDALPVLRDRLSPRESDRLWADWLNRRRDCADIRILDDSFDVPSSTPGPWCGSTSDE